MAETTSNHNNSSFALKWNESKATWNQITASDWMNEISGAFGDMGTLLPLLANLVSKNQVSLPASLIFGGFFNIATGFWFDIPMCVQPMKSIAAIALLGNLTPPQIAAAGLFVSITLVFLVLTGLCERIRDLVPHCLIRGIQLGTGLSLFASGINMIQQSQLWSFTGYNWMDNYVIAMVSFLFVLGMYPARRNPSCVVLFVIGIVFAVIKYTNSGPRLALGSSYWIVIPNSSDVANGIMKAGLGQLPLTLLNSVYAVSLLASDLFPERKQPVVPANSVALSVGLMNIVGVWFGSVPYCHGVHMYNVVWRLSRSISIWIAVW